MADLMLEDSDDQDRATLSQTRPSLAQVKALVEFIQKHPDLAHRKLRNGVARQKIKKLWIQVSNIANSLEGTLKSTKGWIKFWSDKRRSIMLKQKQIEEGKIRDTLTPLEQKIYDMCSQVNISYGFKSKGEKATPAKKRKRVKIEPCDDEDDDSMDNLFLDTDDLTLNNIGNGRLLPTESEERQLNMMDKLVDVMAQQAQAMAQIAQATQTNTKALERLAEASHMQAVTVDRVASTFENINTNVHDVRMAIMSIDYTMKRCYTTTAAQQRQNSNLFS